MHRDKISKTSAGKLGRSMPLAFSFLASYNRTLHRKQYIEQWQDLRCNGYPAIWTEETSIDALLLKSDFLEGIAALGDGAVKKLLERTLTLDGLCHHAGPCL